MNETSRILTGSAFWPFEYMGITNGDLSLVTGMERAVSAPSTLVGAFWRVSRRHPGDHRARLAAGRGARRSVGSRRLEDGDRCLGPERRAGVRAREELHDGAIPVGGHPPLA